MQFPISNIVERAAAPVSVRACICRERLKSTRSQLIQFDTSGKLISSAFKANFMTHTYFNLLLARRARNLLLGNTNNDDAHRGNEKYIKAGDVCIFSLVNAPPLCDLQHTATNSQLKLSPLPGVLPIFCSARREKRLWMENTVRSLGAL